MQYSSNPLIAHLNINSLQNKIDALRLITKNLPLDILCNDEKTLDDSFPDYQFKIDGYQFAPFRRDTNKFGGEKIVKDGLLVTRLNERDIHELDSEMNKGKFYDSDKTYDYFFNLFKTITDKHAPIKRTKVRGNNAPSIMDRS